MNTSRIIATFGTVAVAVAATVAFAQSSRSQGDAVAQAEAAPVKNAVTYARVLDAPSQKVWAVVSGADSWAEWIPFLSASECEGDHVGAKRVCVMLDPGNQMGLDGYRIQEEILENNDETRTFRYSISNPPLPLSGFEGTVQVLPQGDQSLVFWTATFNAAQEASEPNRQMLVQMYHGSLVGLEAHANN